MKNKEGQKQYSWFSENSGMVDTYDTIEEAIADAQDRYDSCDEPFEESDCSSIYVGEVSSFNLKEALKDIVRNLDYQIYHESMPKFADAFDGECECSLRIDRDVFASEIADALLPIVEKHLYIYPFDLCSNDGEYDLEKREWIRKMNK